MKKITIINSNLGFGGIEQFLSSLCLMFDKEYEINLYLVYKIENEAENLFSDRVNIKYIFNYQAYPKTMLKHFFTLKFYKGFKEGIRGFNILINWKRKLKKLVKSIDSDYLLTTRLKETKIVNKYANNNVIKICTEHNYPTDNYVVNLIKNTTNFDKVVVVSEGIKRLYETFIKDKCYVIPNCLTYFPNNKSKLDNDNLISIGRFNPEKGFFDLIDVIKIVKKTIPNIKLTLIGDGNLYSLINDKIVDNNLTNNIQLTGFLNKNEIEGYLLNSSIYLMTSLSESFGIALLEAMSYGLPSISFDNEGANNLLNNDVGIIIKNRDKDLMAKEIINLLNDKKRLTEYSLKSISKSHEYNLMAIKKLWEKILK